MEASGEVDQWGAPVPPGENIQLSGLYLLENSAGEAYCSSDSLWGAPFKTPACSGLSLEY